MDVRILQFFQQYEDKRDFQNGDLVSLTDRDGIFAFETPAQGLNFFAIPKQGTPGRIFLRHANHLVFFSLKNGSLQDPYDITLLCEGMTRVWTAPEIKFNEATQCDPLLAAAFIPLLEERLEGLASIYVKKLPESSDAALAREGKISLYTGQLLLASRKQNVALIRILSGKLEVFGEKDLALEKGEIYPVTKSVWLQASVPTQIEVCPLLPNWLESAHRFILFYHTLLPRFIEETARSNLFFLNQRYEAQEQQWSLALRQLNTFASGSFLHLRANDSPLQQACKHIGKAMGVEFHLPPSFSSDTEEALDQICEVSQIRKRAVQMTGNWWKENHGPLLGFEGASKHPIALIPIPSGGYEQINGLMQTRIDETTGQTILPQKIIFFAPFPKNSFRWQEIFFHFIKQNFRISIDPFVYTVIGTLLTCISPFAVKLFFSRAIPQHSSALVWYLFYGLFCTAVGTTLFYSVRNIASLRLQIHATSFLQSGLWDRLFQLAPRFFRRYTVGNLFSRLLIFDEMRKLLPLSQLNLLLTGLVASLFFIPMALYSARLTFLVLALVAAGGGLGWIFIQKRLALLSQFIPLQETLRGLNLEIIAGLAKVRTSGAMKSAFAYWISLYAKLKSLQFRAQIWFNATATLGAVIPLLTYWGVFSWMIHSSPFHEISLPNFLAFIAGFGMFASLFYPAFAILVKLSQFSPLWKQVQVILEEPVEQTGERINPGPLLGRIKLEHVSFRYSQEAPFVLEDISFEIEPQSFVGIVGTSGSGKSTLLRLLLGFERPDTGAIYYDNKNLESLNLYLLRKQLGIVFQSEERGIFPGSLYDNIVFGRRYEKRQIDKALDISGFAEDLKEMPMGLHTLTNSGGSLLSGGQRQRLLLARALISKPPILILDEATSSMDSTTQKRFMQAQKEMSMTRIVVAHRLVNLRNADQIFVLHEGALAEQGTFDELTEKRGLFTEMSELQKL